MYKLRFIINPASGFGSYEIAGKIINENLDNSLFDYELCYTKAAGHASELAKEAVLQRFDIVAAVGGDGSVNEVGKALVGSETALAIIPTGSGNGLARHLGIPVDIRKSVCLVNRHNTKKIDTVAINSETFISIAGVGFDAHIASEFSKFGKRGFGSYIKLVIREFFNYEAQDYELNIDGNKMNVKAFFICFANSSQHGNNATIAPQAIIDDGYIDICIIKKFPPYMLPVLAYRLFNKTMDKSRYMETIKGKEIIVKQGTTKRLPIYRDSTLPVHLDGEPLDLGKELHLKINPLSLKVIVP